MNNKHILIINLFLLTSFSMASPHDELTRAQAEFRQALNSQSVTNASIQDLQSKLNEAQKRKLAADADVERLSKQLNAAQQQKQAHDAALQQAGERLNASWQAVRGLAH